MQITPTVAGWSKRSPVPPSKDVECEEEVIVENPEEIVEEPKDDKYEELKRDIDDLRKEHDELKGIVEELKNTINAILEKPAAEPIVEEFNKVTGSKAENGIPVFGSRAKRFN